MNREVPLPGSTPTVAISRPTSAMSRPSIRLSPAKLMIVARPRIITASISGGPKLSANSANGGARATSRASEMIAATNEPIAEIASAAPARPCRAIW